MPAILWTMVPNFLPFFIKTPPPPKYQMIKITINSGNAVPRANMDGRINPYELDSTTGIKVTKNRINMVGQKAKEKLKTQHEGSKTVSLLVFLRLFKQFNSPFQFNKSEHINSDNN